MGLSQVSRMSPTGRRFCRCSSAKVNPSLVLFGYGPLASCSAPQAGLFASIVRNWNESTVGQNKCAQLTCLMVSGARSGAGAAGSRAHTRRFSVRVIVSRRQQVRAPACSPPIVRLFRYRHGDWRGQGRWDFCYWRWLRYLWRRLCRGLRHSG